MPPVTPATAFAAHRFSIAPMLDWTDRHCRYFLRLLSRETLLYTEMVTTGAIIHGKG
ncbi:MAG TPA: tRNA dihydrouridine(20/20a) synthase DusA, partial [Escherichia sp.]|nr:tRNA dihydrouridine(20/20a) synthase DusA [Escherichia sp.]